MIRPILALFLLALLGKICSAEPVQLLYMERLPYMQASPNGDVAGLTATPTQTAFLHAGIPFQWKKAGADIQLQILKENRVQACLVGWFKNAEREKLGKYSHAVFEDKPTVALTLADNAKMKDIKTMRDLFQNRELSLLIKEGYSYGLQIDSLLVRYGTRTVAAIGDNINMMGMLVQKRADYFLVAEDEALALKQNYAKDPAFKILRFSDEVPGEARYLWCTRLVPDATIDKLNEELDKQKSVRAVR
jgi:uncharacterized protein (TIGR02285 family)